MFAQRLNVLFQLYRAPADQTGRREEYPAAEIARVAAEVSRRPMPRQTVSSLRRGASTQPTLEIASAIAHAFAHLASRNGEAADASAILSWLASDRPVDPLVSNEEVLTQLAQPPPAPATKVQVMARLADVDDPEALQQIAEFVDELSRPGGLREWITRRWQYGL